MTVCRCALTATFSLGFLTCSVLAESNSGASENTREKRITLTQTVEPSFHIEPIVHRFAARRGTVVPFKFEIRSTGKAMDVSVFPVRLRQEVTGIILHDLSGEPPEEMKFSTPSRFKLAPGETQYIEGTLTVPLAKSNFLSFGVLVRDNGQASTRDSGASGGQTKAGVRFVTQYVLRVDIETGVKDLSQMDHLAFDQGQVIRELGMPVAQTMLVNPTDFAFECSVRGTIESSSTSRPKPFRMTLPSRVNMEGDQRYLIRIMPQSRVRLTAPVDALLFPGNQALRLEVTNGRRALVDQSFDVNVGQGDFPALETQLAYLDDALSVQPAQVELGSIGGTKRTSTLRFTNNSIHSKSVRLDLKDLNGNALDGVRFSDDDFEVKPGRTKTIRASIQRNEENVDAKYGVIQLAVRDNDGSNGVRSIPLAMLFAPRAVPNVKIGELQSVEANGHTSFSLMVTNQGEGYVPVHAQLAVANGSGSALELADGYGRWLRPGETRELVFSPPKNLEAGRYQLSLNLQTTPDQDPVSRTLIIQLTPESSSESQADELAAEPREALKAG